MKRSLTFLFLTLLFLSAKAQAEKKIIILHTNDLHSRLAGFAPEAYYSPLSLNDDKTTGGFARIAAILKNEKEKNMGITLIADAGDFLMGTLFQGMEAKTGFQLRLMKIMGYDVAAIGNHEFDPGPENLSVIINTSLKGGDIPQLLLSNAVFDTKDPADDSLEDLFSRGIIAREMVITRDGLKIGFFSLLGKVADENAAFAPPVTFSRQVPAAKKIIKNLQKQGCELIICLSHSGLYSDKSGRWRGEDYELAEKVKGIDVIISGHTHTRIEKPLIVNGVPIVQTGEYGQSVGKLSLTCKNGNVSVDGYSLIPVDDRVEGDPAVNLLIEEQKKIVTEEILRPLGMSYDSKVVETDFPLECNEMGDIEGSNLGPLVADAIHNYVNRHVKTGTDISMVAVGVIRDRIVPGYQTAPDIFRIMSLGSGRDNIPGYPLARLYVTGKELKSILEILMVAYKSTPANYCYFSGLNFNFDPGRRIFRKVSNIRIVRPDGTDKVIDISKKNRELYSITANAYMLEFIGIIKKMSFGLINVVPRDAEGNPVRDMKNSVLDIDENLTGLQEGKEWLALMEYLSSMNDINGNSIPDIDLKYRVPVRSYSVPGTP